MLEIATFQLSDSFSGSFIAFFGYGIGIVQPVETKHEGKPMSATTEKDTAKVLPSARQRHEQMLQADRKAKIQFTEKFEGASIKVKTVLHNRPVIRAFKRMFNISMRNWHLATSIPRSELGDPAIATNLEMAMLKKIAETSDLFKRKIGQYEIVAKEADVDFSLISHGTEFAEETRIIGPVAMQLYRLFLLADRYLDLTTALYSYGQLTMVESNQATYDVKKKLEAINTSIRNFRLMAMEKVNSAGKARPGFKAVVVDGDDAGKHVGAASETGASNVTPIVQATGEAPGTAANEVPPVDGVAGADSAAAADGGEPAAQDTGAEQGSTTKRTRKQA